jgi:hypothetical protein
LGGVSIGYIPGCDGYTSEAPSFVMELDSQTPERLKAFFIADESEANAEGVLVMSPSGEANCADEIYVAEVPAQRGRFGVWVVTKSPSARVKGELYVRQD